MKNFRTITWKTGLCLVALSLGFTAKAQLLVNGTSDINALAESISGNGVSISNAQITCASDGFGTFNATNTNLGASEGVLLTSGNINNAIGPNDEEDETDQQWTSGSNLLNVVTNRTTYDACMLEFDIVPRGDTLSFDFVFASEEYNEWVGSQYNDVFAFFISGPGITGDPGIGNDHNIALIPNTSTAIAINNVNANDNSAYYVDNPAGGTIQYDGFTTGLKAVSQVTPCETYHLKLVIADASDRKWDSGVFIEKIESNDATVSYVTANGMDEMIEGCNSATITFVRPNALPVPEDVVIYLGGSTTNGADYPLVGTDPDVNVPKIVTIPANEFSAELVIDPIADGLLEGQEQLVLYIGNGLCPGVYLDSLTIPVLDSLPAAVFPPADTICLGDQVQFTSIGGDTFSWTGNDLSANNIPNPIATPSASADYSMTTTAGTCSETVQVHIEVVEMTLSPIIEDVSCNGGSDGSIDVTINGGFSPFNIDWNGPNGFNASTKEITDLLAGTYIVDITDATGCTARGTYTISEPAALSISAVPTGYTFGHNVSCYGGNDGNINTTISGGTSPYIVHWSGPNGFQSMDENLEDLEAGTYDLAVEDANGCSATYSLTLVEPDAILITTGAIDHVDCFGNANGSASVNISGGIAPYDAVWNTTPVTNGTSATNLEGGTYTVTVTDGYNCQQELDVEIQAPITALTALIDSITPVACFGEATGEVYGSASGGTPPYFFEWNTNPVSTTEDIVGIPAGNYTLTVTDINGCAATADAEVEGPLEQHYAYVESQVNVECYGDSTGSGTLFIGGGSGSYTTVWDTDPPQYGPTVTGLPVGTYWSTTTDNAGCLHEKLVPLVITGPSAPLSGTLDPSVYNGFNISCYGESDGSIDLTPNGGTPPYYFTWTGYDGSTTGIEDVSGLDAGWYYIEIMDSKGCTWSDSLEMTQPAEIILDAVSTPTACQGSANGAIDLGISGGEPGYMISWVGPNAFTSSNEDINSLEAGTYTATVVDNIGCVATLEVIVSQPGDLAINSVQSTYPGPYNVSCPEATDGTIDITVTGGNGNYTYSWSGPNAFTSTDEDISGLEAGSYTVVATDGNGCSIDLTVDMTAPDALDIALDPSNYNGTNLSCSNSADGSIETILTGGVLPYTISWTGPDGYAQSNQNIFNLAPGTYYINVSDVNGCNAQDSLTLTTPDTLITAVSSPTLNGGFNIGCNGESTGSIDLDISGGVGPFDTDWSGPNGYTSSDEDISGLEAGTYAVFITDANGCTSDQVITLTEAPEWLNTVASPTYTGGWNVSCTNASDGSIDLSISGSVAPYTVAWTGPNGFTSSDEDISNLEAGTYNAIVSDANGCNDTLIIDLTAPAPLAANMAATVYANGVNTSCGGTNDAEIDLTISGGTPAYTINWTGPNGFASTIEDLNGLEAGTYYLEVIDTNGCTFQDSIELVAPDSLLLELAAGQLNGNWNISCAGSSDGSIDLDISSGNGPFSYSWTGPNGFTADVQDLNNLGAGIYYITVTDTFGCSVNDSIELLQPDSLNLVANALTYPGGDNISCSGANDGSIDLSVSGGTAPYSFNWLGPDSTYTTEDLSNVGAGVYTLTVEDANGCTDTLSVELTEPVSITSQLTSTVLNGGTNVSCNSASDGNIDLEISGGSAPFTTQWTGPNGFTSTDEDLAGLSAGSYAVQITDANGCSIVNNIVLTEPDTLNTELYSPVFGGGFNIACAGDTSGVLEASTTGGVPGYTYSWVGPNGFTSDQMQIGGLHAGLYTLTTTDTNGCSVVDTLTLSQPTDTLGGILDALVQPSGTNISCHGGSDGAIDATLFGGIPPYLLEWRGPDAYVSSDEDISGLAAGEYELVVIDINECPLTLTIELTEPDTGIYTDHSLSQFPGGWNVPCHNSDNGTLDLDVQGGSPGYTVNWSGPNGFTDSGLALDSLMAGTYTVNVVDTNGCVFNQDIELLAPDMLASVLDASTFPSGDHISCYGANDGSIDATMIGGTPGYQLQWTGPNGFGSTNMTLSALAPGEYCLAVVDTNACTANVCVTLTEPAQLDLSATSDTAHCGVATATIDLNVNGGSAPYSFLWDGQTGSEDLNGANAGDHTVVVTDINGCEMTLVQNVYGTDAVEGELYTTDVICNSDDSGAIDLEMTSGTQPFSFEWSTGADTEDIADLLAGIYSVNVVDSNGCEMAATTEILENEAMTADSELSNYNGFNISTFEGSDGWIELLMGGSTAPFSFLWNTGDTTAMIEGLEAGTYQVLITDANGCQRTLDFELTEPNDLVLPTGFSPNGDGANDGFVVQGIEAYPQNNLKVVNRWGNTVYEANNYKNQWNGENMQGQALPDATYFVILSVNGGQRNLAGYVDLRR